VTAKHEYSKVTVHFMLSAFDKKTACGRKYSGIELTTIIENSNCKGCKTAYRLNQLKEELDNAQSRNNIHG
jgi:hypothetical protein